MEPGIRFSACACALLLTFATFANAGVDGPAESSTSFPPTLECIQHRTEAHGGISVEERQHAMHQEIERYQSLAEEALSMRAQAIQLHDELVARQKRREPLSGHDLVRLNEGGTALLDQREALLKTSLAHECWIDDPVSDDPREAAIQSAGIAMSLSAALLLYDNYLSAISLYRSDSKLRRHLNRADKGFALREGELNRIALSFASPNNRYRVRRAIAWFENHGYGSVDRDDKGYRYLVELIEQSPSRQIVRKVQPVSFVGRMAGFFTTVTFDTLMSLKEQGVSVPSLLFGNAVGLVETRRGKLDARPAVLQQVSTQLKAGDVLLEKTPFRLTDAFIPGHWGHAAVWIGRAEELRELGIWDHPVVRSHHAQIEAGHGVVEALRSGVEMNSLNRFMNVDDLAVLRETSIPDGQRAQVVLQALRQVGKDYDFNFDVESTDKIVCSELVYHAYSHRQWPTAKHLGRVTISPDNVALRAMPGDVMDIILLYHDGKEVADRPMDFMAGLLKKPLVEETPEAKRNSPDKIASVR